ncbi:hypothetical protein J7E93_16780 [Streptomyces sp. ISL-36]|uniref:SSI family serine proteinase inhibitor n=1 Tax=Streptomyces sp. ISL-36 TaxID=2819182 RepID=UPI001BE96498|nr:SSI family serine proteinase inhibitor [Streptomyces sp. ISL-36]MBT2441738.1 hypothetical protein [Streptomyces sp. ISL-36]
MLSRPARAAGLIAACATALTTAVFCGTATAARPMPADLVDRPDRAERSDRSDGADRADRLRVTVVGSGTFGRDGTYELYCHPAGGDHPDAAAACDKLDALTVWGSPGPFPPVPSDDLCTLQYGGPAVAYVEGTWAGRPVNADFTRTDGCEISRWDALVPLLPAAGG